jgi:nucleolar protein 4
VRLRLHFSLRSFIPWLNLFDCLTVILPNTPAASTLPPVELEKRTNSFNARRALLRSNPSLYISRTRLSVRQIPLWVTERGLKRLAIHATKSFEREVREGKRAPLAPDELREVNKEEDVQEEDQDREEKKGKEKKKFLGRPTAVKQTKIIRQSERVDAITGKGRSKGYGFVEMHTHANALRVLRWANNNDEVGSLLETWWVEELGDVVKHEREKLETEGEDRDEARLKRMMDELARGGRSKGEKKGNLIVEFSIENVQVVKRRSERVSVCASFFLTNKDTYLANNDCRHPML